jgi:hypothetical protein
MPTYLDVFVSPVRDNGFAQTLIIALLVCSNVPVTEPATE